MIPKINSNRQKSNLVSWVSCSFQNEGDRRAWQKAGHVPPNILKIQ